MKDSCPAASSPMSGFGTKRRWQQLAAIFRSWGESGCAIGAAGSSAHDPKRSSGCQVSPNETYGISTSGSVGIALASARWSGGEARGAGRSTSRRKGDFARESFRAPVEAHLALQLASNHAVHHARAEALTRRWLDRRATRLGPAKDEASV
jgi:hypothetical protein